MVSGLSAQGKKDFSLQEIWASGSFRQQSIQGMKSMKDGNHYSLLNDEYGLLSIDEYTYAEGKKTRTLFSARDFKLADGKKLVFDDYVFSSDESKILVSIDFEPIYRYSGKSAYVVIDLKNKKADYLSDGKQLLADFSPDGNFIAFVEDNNLFYKNLITGKEFQITTDGKTNQIINGSTDWVYEEEFGFTTAFYWSPDSKKIAWLRFDESAVKEYSMPTYGELYPNEYRFKYPKAGEDNSLVTAWIFDLEKSSSIKVNTGDDKDQYLPRVKWTNSPNALSIIRMNRHQNHLELLLADPNTGNISLLLEEKNNTYIDINDNLLFLNDGKHFIWSSELNGFNQLYLYDIKGNRVRSITGNESDVTAFYGYDDKNQTLYYQAATPTPSDRSLFSIRLSGKGAKQLINYPGHNKASFSSNYNYFILTNSTGNSPEIFELYNNKGKKLKVLEDNKELQNILKEYSYSPKEFFSFVTSYGVSLNGWMIKPPNFNPEKKYPVFMTVYGGPGHNTVENSWGGTTHLWHQMLAQKGYIVVSVDNRGTGNRGEAFKKSTYKQLGKLETEDQMATALYLAGLPYVDRDRIGIQGWSYGGYMSSLCITKGSELFKMAIAVAPVTNWRFYDSIYTERFMQTPEENASGYDDNSPINFVTRLKGKYLLIHGTADDNVHFQNTVEMTDALVKANKQFDLFFYPDKNHGIYGGNTRLHLFTLMTNYILKNL